MNRKSLQHASANLVKTNIKTKVARLNFVRAGLKMQANFNWGGAMTPMTAQANSCPNQKPKPRMLIRAELALATQRLQRRLSSTSKSLQL
jgi:hypothetical protein